MKPIFKLENQTGREGLYFDKKSHSYQEYDEIKTKKFDFDCLIFSLLKRISEKNLDNSFKKLSQIFISCYSRLILKEIIKDDYNFKHLRQESDFIFCQIFNLSLKYDEKYYQKLREILRKYLNKLEVTPENREIFTIFERKFREYHLEMRDIQAKKTIDKRIEQKKGEI